MLKPNKIARTVYPDQPCTDFNEWSASITRAEIQHSADDFKAKFDALWEEFKQDVRWNT